MENIIATGEISYDYQEGSRLPVADNFIILQGDIAYHQEGTDVTILQKSIDESFSKTKPNTKSMHKKLVDREITRSDYNKWYAQKRGFKNYREYREMLAEKKGYKNRAEREAKRQMEQRRTKGIKPIFSEMFRKFKEKEITWSDYVNWLAKKKGFKDSLEYQTHIDYKAGRRKSMQENKDCSLYLGVHIAEQVLSKVFESVVRMPHGNEKYDFVCKKGYKIDVKSACLHKNKGCKTEFWRFQINHNDVADYFLCLGFDNRNNLNPLKIWLLKGSEIVREKEINKFSALQINNTIVGTAQFEIFEQKDKLEKTIKCCDSLRAEQ